MHDWYRYVDLHIRAFEFRGMNLTSIQESHNRLRFGVVDEKARESLGQIFTAIDLPCFLAVIGITHVELIGS